MHDWEAIREQHGRLVWQSIGRVLRNVEDITDCYQDVFLEAFQRANSQSIKNMPGFLRWLAVHRALDFYRKNKPRSAATAHFDMDTLACDASDKELRRDELLDSVRFQLTLLPQEQAEAFWLCCVEEFKYREAAEVMRLTPEHVGVLLQRARQHLATVLGDWASARTF